MIMELEMSDVRRKEMLERKGEKIPAATGERTG
jgi:hypothetical protein